MPREAPRGRGGASRPEVVVLSRAASAAIERGHPWAYRDGVTRGGGGLATGAVVEVADASGRPIARGLWDADSPIAVRVFVRGAAERLDPALVAARVERALARRDAFLDVGATNAYRLCNGEGDRVPSLVLDRYADVVVARLDGALLAPWLTPIAERIFPALRARGIRTIARRVARGESAADGKLEPLLGDAPPASLTVVENGVRMVVDLRHGQKTGAFLDQRDNRARVRAMARGRRVLNLFSYAGGFSTAAALGGAARVTSVDIAHAAHATAQASMRENGVEPAAHEFVTADAFAYLEAARRRGATFDLVVSDPPSFAPSERATPRALVAYRKLHAACAAVLAPGGILCAASCSSHVSPELFLSTLDDASLGRADLALVALHGAGADHPIVPAWVEGRYLKFAVLA